jgi:hypothetical protein
LNFRQIAPFPDDRSGPKNRQRKKIAKKRKKPRKYRAGPRSTRKKREAGSPGCG